MVIIVFILSVSFAVMVILATSIPIGITTACTVENAIEYKESCQEKKADIDLTAANLLKAADTILTFTDKNTETYKEIFEAIADARKSNYSASSIDRVINVVHENYPTDMELGKQWSKYTTVIEECYTSILSSQCTYNYYVKLYKSHFTPVRKILMLWLVEEDKTISYYTLNDYQIDYEIKNK